MEQVLCKKLIDKSHKKRYILFINALKKSVHRLGPYREPGAAENPAGKIRKINIVYKDRRSVDVNKIILDNSKISNICDIKLISLENGIEKTIDHLKKYQNIWK